MLDKSPPQISIILFKAWLFEQLSINAITSIPPGKAPTSLWYAPPVSTQSRKRRNLVLPFPVFGHGTCGEPPWLFDFETASLSPG